MRNTTRPLVMFTLSQMFPTNPEENGNSSQGICGFI